MWPFKSKTQYNYPIGPQPYIPPPDWSGKCKIGTCIKCNKPDVKLAFDRIDKTYDCFNCAQNKCFGITIRAMS